MLFTLVSPLRALRNGLTQIGYVTYLDIHESSKEFV